MKSGRRRWTHHMNAVVAVLGGSSSMLTFRSSLLASEPGHLQRLRPSFTDVEATLFCQGGPTSPIKTE